MTVPYVAFVPARGASKSIPGKNVRPMAGRPLICWTVGAAVHCDRIGRVVVSTDSAEIERAVLGEFGDAVEIHHRSAENATDTASTESVMLEYARDRDDFERMVLIQATSPLLTAGDLARGIERLEEGGFDSLLSVVRQKRFIWTEDGDGAMTPANYAIDRRPRRQEFDGQLVENGAFYVVSRSGLLATGCRMGGRIGAIEMDEETYHEIDEPADWTIVEGLLARRSPQDSAPGLSRIKALFTDCDGVLTDGGMYYSEAGDELKRFQTRDGHGFELLREAGIVVGIITSESAGLVERRARKLGLDEVVTGTRDKLGAIERLCEKHGLSLDEVAYLGDDVIDLPAVREVGWGCSVRDGMPAVRDAARFVTEARGGEGAVREVAEMVLAARARTEA